MSECRTEQIKCPRCHYDSPMTVWNSINADLNPELKNELLDGELFHWKCEVCGLEIDVPFGTLYHDMEHKFMLFFSPNEDEEDKYKEIKIPLPSGLEFRKYTLRTVYGLDQLREKISILEFGLNDIAVERMKFFIRLSDYDILPHDKLFFLKVDTDPEEMKSFGFERGAIKFLCLKESKSPGIMPFPMEHYFDYLLAVDTDPRMRVDFCTCVDEGWMMMKLQNL